MSHFEAETTLPYSAEQLFSLAADVERYPEFLPGWVAARVRAREEDIYCTDQVLRFGPFRERFTTRTVLHPPHRIEVSSQERPFRDFRLTWSFEPTPEGGCHVTLATRIAFRAPLAERLFGRTLARLADEIVAAFARRAHRLYATGGPRGDSGRAG